MGAPQVPWRHPVEPNERPSHPLGIDETHRTRDALDGFRSILQAHPRRFDTQAFNSLGRRIACLSLKCSGELANAQMGYFSKTLDRQWLV